ncbi:MAG TPA: hypothetical protein VGY54_03170 [Polyangiaceae bacterium]|jgi:hypothetical protein|nr:hypothetical protein [Polyangiaceae bacterium]
MGHEILTYRGRSAIINDFDFVAVRHFLLIASEAARLGEVTTFVAGWIWEGPGVWTGEDLDVFLHGDETVEQRFSTALEAALAHVLAFGERFPPGYLEKHAKLSECSRAGEDGSRWGSEMRTGPVADAMGQIRDLLSKSAPLAPTP